MIGNIFVCVLFMELKMITEDIKDVASKIGFYYLQKNNNDYKKTYQELESLRIQQILVLDSSTITIILSRPGLLIGVRGTNLDNLEKFINKSIYIVEARETILDYLMPMNLDELY